MFCGRPSLTCDNICDFVLYNYSTASFYAKLLQWHPEINEILNTIGNAQIIFPSNNALGEGQTLINFPFPYSVEDVLLYHIVPSLEQGRQETLLQNNFVEIQETTINDANILQSFVVCNRNGERNVIRQVDKLLFPVVE